jgi:hypothetical protein
MVKFQELRPNRDVAKGGERAYRGRLWKDRRQSNSRRSIASAK